MLSKKLKKEIEDISLKLTRENIFFLNCQQGKLLPQNIQFYLKNVHFLFQQTGESLLLAHKISKENNDEDLANYFKKKYYEELGHDQWALNDLEHFGISKDMLRSFKPHTSLTYLMNFIKTSIKKNPRNYFCYMSFAEYFTVLTAPDFLKNLEEKCHISLKAMTAIAKHAELDKEHTTEDFATIDSLVEGKVNSKEFFKVLNVSVTKVDQFLHDVARGIH